MADDAGAGDAGELDRVAAELVALPPAEFTAARNARAAAATGGLRAAIKALVKPTAAAWAVDALAREASGELGEALELAGALREAQQELDGAELARLGRQRRQLVAALARRAVDVAKAHGVVVGAAAQGDVERTVNAAVLDPAAAAAVLTARLVRPLAADGVEPVDLDGAVAGSIPGVADAPPPPSRDDLAERRARRAAEQAAREADRAANEAERELTRIETRLAKARERADLLAERQGDLRAELARIERDAQAATDDTARLEKERTSAAAAASAARTAAEKAHRAVRD